MKKLGKAILGLVAAVAMLVTGLVAPLTAVAAESTPNTTITIKSVNKGDEFKAWRLLDASQDAADATKISYTLNATYKNILKTLANSSATTDEQLLTDITTYLGSLTSETTRTFADSAYAKVKDLTEDASAKAAADGDVTLSNTAGTTLPQGYYLVAQTVNGKTGDSATSGDAYSLVMLDTKGLADAEITTKKGVPTFEKKVQDINDSTESKTDAVSGNGTWADSADHDLGDVVPFQFKSTMPDKIDSYTTYKYIFHDSMSKGLTFNKNSVKVYLDSVSADKEIDSNSYTVASSKDEGFSDANPAVADNDGTNFTISFTDLKTATINNNKINLTKDSVIYVEYTGTVNGDAKIGNPGNPNEAYLEFENNPNDEGKGTSRTPNDKVVVFTYQVDVNKVDGENQPLPGAGFTLYKKIKDSTKDEGAGAGWEKVPTGVNADGTLKYEEIKATKTDDGKYVAPFLRVDDGQYKLVETTVPGGYKKAKDVEFTITAEHDTTITSLTIKVGDTTTNGDITSGTVGTTVINNAGSELPSTGGMGTVILYALGAAFVAAAGAWFAFRRRLSNR
ncbi:SpaH/EbpB family LPXTG-anchored major pilin [Bifidobacterium simiiventris]|uniref:SpaH/EbpB family LPXTG-anchored major pilin n=1 Tax=Bifidobacterium simiiventris TaxID=2834434 RepID=UPI001C56D97B|nr:SpaH/EbpB family LPXTG-anchored major pilin [Bifidobacterium simiiventris]MBW3079160.1 SpaH/EbpB family LPXTG-anchored major pilin [Bifidobacterium simiiventris]